MSSLEEIPSMVKLDALQLMGVILPVFGADGVVDGGCRKEGSHGGGSGEPAVLAAEGIRDGRDENRHEVGQGDGAGGREVLFSRSRFPFNWFVLVLSIGRRSTFAGACGVRNTTTRWEFPPTQWFAIHRYRVSSIVNRWRLLRGPPVNPLSNSERSPGG